MHLIVPKIVGGWEPDVNVMAGPLTPVNPLNV